MRTYGVTVLLLMCFSCLPIASARLRSVAAATSEEIAFARNFSDGIVVSGRTVLPSVGIGGIWTGFVLATTTGKLYAAPARGSGDLSMLIVDPETHATARVPTVGNWIELTYATNTLKIYGVPDNVLSGLLIFNPATNESATVPILAIGLNRDFSFAGVTFCPTNGKVYAAPDSERAALIFDPTTNVTDGSRLPLSVAHIAPPNEPHKWRGMAYVDLTDKV